MVEPLGWVARATQNMRGATPAAEPVDGWPAPTHTRAAPPAAAEPLDEPPGVRALSSGFRVGPGAYRAYSDVTVLPSTMAPAARRRATMVASCSGRRPWWTLVPYSVGMSAV